MSLRLDDLLKEKKAIYVKNMTNPRGQIVLTIADTKSGRIHKIAIPKIELPICLSDRLNSELIDASTDLRHYISKGVLELVEPARAEEILNREDNRLVVRTAMAKAENA
ncbi:MAG: hypothetical protein WC895_04975, partial [Candidatus Shapirobacteria bacterium]